MNLKERAKQLKTDIPAVAYALSPIDLIPDFIPVLGFLDDVILLPALIALTVKFIPKETFERCRKEAGEKRDHDKADAG